MIKPLMTVIRRTVTRGVTPMRQMSVKSAFLHFGFSSSSELEESSLEKLKSLWTAHAQDIIF
jgi:hypothetical protein